MRRDTLKKILTDFKDGKITEEKALQLLEETAERDYAGGCVY
jgi:hypothetical protein